MEATDSFPSSSFLNVFFWYFLVLHLAGVGVSTSSMRRYLGLTEVTQIVQL